MKAVLSLKRLDSLIINEKPGDLSHEQALQFAAEDNAKVLWDIIRATFIGRGEDRKIDEGNELKNIAMKNGEPVGDYIARARGISTKYHSLRLDVLPRELVYHNIRGLNGKFSKVRDILKTQREKSTEEVLQILREEETTFNLSIKTRMNGINAEEKNEKQTRLCYMCRKSNHQAKDCYYRNKNSPSTSQRNITQRNNSSRNGHVFTASHREEELCDNTWILNSGASCHMAKESVWFKNISSEVIDIYLADKNFKMMSQGTGNVSAKTIRTDNGLEFVNEQLDTYLANSGIFHEKTIPYNSESNGKAERTTRVLLERARSLLCESKLPLEFWAEAINCSTQVSNITPRKGKEKIPLEIWTGEIENETWYIDSFFEVSPERNEINKNTENGVLSNFDTINVSVEIENDNPIPLLTTSSPQTGGIQLRVLEMNDIQNQIPVRRSERLKSKQMSVHLTNNVPNSYFEAKNSANWQNWKLAMKNQLDSLDKHKFLKSYKNLRNQN
ncbi:retrovirus-related Pol polyprotein from transposon TNT 1-94 [Trichonephila clavipes]|nr:retrovirus-related Pol polyprotein from transposon TNT 1-94 [Trichonephila clavipes]